MTNTELIFLIFLFFVTSVVGVVTGSNSLITVPVMFQFGIDPKMAVATNMFGLTFMSIGATIPFIRNKTIDAKKLSPLIVLTLVGSAIGALLVGYITTQSVKLLVSVAMVGVVIFTFVRREQKEPANEKRALPMIGYTAAFLLAIYGGLYSGGYITVLTPVLVAFLGMSYTESIGSTKLINVFSSLIATAIFMWQGLVHYRLGAILAVTMFIGAYVGAHLTVKLNEIWLKRIFLATVLILAAKLLFDLFAAQ